MGVGVRWGRRGGERRRGEGRVVLGVCTGRSGRKWRAVAFKAQGWSAPSQLQQAAAACEAVTPVLTPEIHAHTHTHHPSPACR